jgi:hypothetical protein
MMPSMAAKPPSSSQPRIPEKFLDVPTQRLYYLSFGLLCQVCFASFVVGAWRRLEAILMSGGLRSTC